MKRMVKRAAVCLLFAIGFLAMAFITKEEARSQLFASFVILIGAFACKILSTTKYIQR